MDFSFTVNFISLNSNKFDFSKLPSNILAVIGITSVK